MGKRVSSLIIIVIVETILLLMLAIAFYELSQDDPCKCYYPPEGITKYTEECSDKVLAEEYTDGYEDGCDECANQECVNMEYKPEGKPSNEYNDIELKYVEGWNKGYEIGYEQSKKDGNYVDTGYDWGYEAAKEECEENSDIDCSDCDCPFITLPEEAYKDGEEDAKNYYTEKFRNYIDYFGEHGFVKPDYNDDIPLWMDFISEYGDIYIPTVEKHMFYHWYSGEGWVFLTGEEYDALDIYFRDVGEMPVEDELEEPQDYVSHLDLSVLEPARCIAFGNPMASICWDEDGIHYEGNFDGNVEQFFDILKDRFGFECPECDMRMQWNEGFSECESICEELLAESEANCHPISGSLSAVTPEFGSNICEYMDCSGYLPCEVCLTSEEFRGFIEETYDEAWFRGKEACRGAIHDYFEDLIEEY